MGSIAILFPYFSYSYCGLTATLLLFLLGPMSTHKDSHDGYGGHKDADEYKHRDIEGYGGKDTRNEQQQFYTGEEQYISDEDQQLRSLRTQMKIKITAESPLALSSTPTAKSLTSNNQSA